MATQQCLDADHLSVYAEAVTHQAPDLSVLSRLPMSNIYKVLDIIILLENS